MIPKLQTLGASLWAFWPQPSPFFRMITLVMRAGCDVNTQQVIELVQRTIGFAVQDATEIAAGLASCKELIIPNLIDSAAIALADAASKAGVQFDLEPFIESEIERDLRLCGWVWTAKW